MQYDRADNKHMADLRDTIHDSAKSPKSVTVDAQNAQQHSLREQIEADEYLEANEAMRRRRLPIRFAKIIPPGAT